MDETRPRPQRPLGLYAWTKGLAEERVLAAHSPGLATVIVQTVDHVSPRTDGRQWTADVSPPGLPG